MRDDDYRSAPTREQHESFCGPLEAMWGEVFPTAGPWAPSMDGDMEFAERSARSNRLEVSTAGDSFFAVFDGPARAIRCARAIVDGGGIAVHIGARVAALAEPGEVLTTSTVKDLVSGSGIAFSDRGYHELKGVPDAWHVFRVA